MVANTGKRWGCCIVCFRFNGLGFPSNNEHVFVCYSHAHFSLEISQLMHTLYFGYCLGALLWKTTFVKPCFLLSWKQYVFWSCSMYLRTWEKLKKDKLLNSVIYISQGFSNDHTFKHHIILILLSYILFDVNFTQVKHAFLCLCPDEASYFSQVVWVSC